MIKITIAAILLSTLAFAAPSPDYKSCEPNECGDERCEIFSVISGDLYKECCQKICETNVEAFFDDHVKKPDQIGKISIEFPVQYDRQNADNQANIEECRNNNEVSHVIGARGVFNYCEALAADSKDCYLKQVLQ